MVKSEFASEADLCAAFIPWAKTQGWISYAETEGWDILLVGTDGTQIGVQAKLKFNMKLLHQTVPDSWSEQWHENGPDFRAILLPRNEGSETICRALGITMLRPAIQWRDDVAKQFEPEIRLGAREGYREGGWHWWCPKKRHDLPAYVPDVPAGASGPTQLTKWKIAALQVCALLEIRGHVTRADFKLIGIDHRRWTGPQGWLDIKDGVYIRGALLDFERQHPTVYAQVLEDVRRDWAEILDLKPKEEKCPSPSAGS